MSSTGHLIALEGTDGSGKATQLKQLVGRLEREGYVVKQYDFPRYDHPSSYFVRQYLSGQYQQRAVTPRQASYFFALDRYDAAAGIQQDLAAGVVVVIDRYTFSNLAHQGGKITDQSERLRFFQWATQLEFTDLGIPEPSLVILLHMHAEATRKLLKTRHSHDYLQGVRDIHESDMEHLGRAEATYLELAEAYKDTFRVIECDESGQPKPIPAIHELVWQEVKALVG